VKHIGWAVMFLGLFSSPAVARGPDYTVGTLARITQLYVMVWDLEADVEADGLSVATIRSDVEQMLSRAGIGIVTTRDYAVAMHRGQTLPPSLVVDVHTMRMATGQYVANIELEIWEAAVLAEHPGVGIPQATTWRAPAVLTSVPTERISDIYTAVRDQTGRFLDDYWAAKLEQVAAPPPPDD
jgi:hypothetical protein